MPPSGIAFLDADLRYLHINPVLAQMNGVSVEDTLGRAVRQVVPSVADECEPYLKKVLSTGQPILNIEIVDPNPAPGTSPRRWLESYYPVVHSGKVQGVGAIVTEVTELHRMQEALQESDHRAQAILETIPDTAWLKDADGRYLAVNSAWCRRTGCEAHKAIGKTVDTFMPAEVARQVDLHDQEVIRAGKPVRRDESMRNAQGRVLLCDTVKAPLFDSNGKVVGTAGISRDITEQRRLEERLRQSQKMEAIGRLAGGIAHDFRNQLAVIKGFAELMLKVSAPSSDDQEMLGEILKAVQRSTSLIGELMTFSRKEMLHPRVVDLAALVNDISKSLPRLIGEHIRLRICAAAPCSAEIDPVGFHQALFNLAANARDAMPGGGDLTIETRLVEIREQDAHLELKTGRYAQVIIHDTGCGMSKEEQSKLFEPFFTTKPMGQGTGLGLATVYGFVKQSLGAIDVKSAPGQGTTFRMWFPAACRVADAPSRQAAPHTLQEPACAMATA